MGVLTFNAQALNVCVRDYLVRARDYSSRYCIVLDNLANNYL